MGEHKGWRVRVEGSAVRAEVRVPGEHRYVSKSFQTVPEAKAWAMTEAGRVASGAPLVNQGIRFVAAEQSADAYLASLVARGRSPSHVANATRSLGHVKRLAPDLAAPSAGLAIERWLDGLDCAPATRNRQLVEIRAFMKWCMRRDLLEKDPTRAIERASVPKALSPQFRLEELQTLLMHQHAYRRRFTLMVYAGLRSDEAAALTWGDIDQSGRVLLIRFHEGFRLKRGRERIVPLQDELLALLGVPGPDEQRIAPIHRNNEYEAFRDFLEDAGVPLKGRSAHSCRHTHAGLMTASGVPGHLLSAYLGHTSAATTMIYTRQASLYVQAVEHWGRGKLRICEGMTSSLKRKTHRVSGG